LLFLLNRRYAPFYKWIHRALKELPILGELTSGLILDIVQCNDTEKKIWTIEKICSRIGDELRREGLSDADGAFLLDHGRSVHEGIRDETLGRKLFVV